MVFGLNKNKKIGQNNNLGFIKSVCRGAERKDIYCNGCFA